MAIAPVPVEFYPNIIAGLGPGGVVGEDMPDSAAFAVSGVDDARASAVPANGATVAGLAAPHGIEDGSIKDDGVVIDAGDDCIACFEIRIVSEQVFGHFVCLTRIIIQTAIHNTTGIALPFRQESTIR